MAGKPPPPPPQGPPRPAPRPAPPTVLRVVTSDHRAVECQPEPFNAGTEGRLYFTRDERNVVKLYSRPEPWREKSLEAIIKKRVAIMGDRPEYWAPYFCWPEARITQPGLGMLMRRAAPDLRPFSHFLFPKFRKRIHDTQGAAALGSWIGHVGILIKLARSVNRLHLNGVCHSDLSINNLLVNPQTGAATLIDCDGLVETGSETLLPTVLGTPDYMAPELVAALTPQPGRPTPQPSVTSDLHSLAVLIYQGLLFRHPLRGGAYHSPDPDEDERLLLGRKALFIEHPTDRSNRPKSTFLPSAVLGPEVQALCARAFIEGLHAPAKRPLAAEWERALVRLYDQTVPCSNLRCEAKSFVLLEGGSARCPWCQTDLKGVRQVPILGFYRMRHDGKSDSQTTFTFDFRFVGWHDRKLHLWHVETGKLPGPGVDAAPLAVIRWEASGAGQERWTLHNQGIGEIYDASGGKAPNALKAPRIELRDGLRLVFGHGERARVVEVHMQRV